jgi:hypothetical protein
MSFSSSCFGQPNTKREYQLTVNKWDKYVGEWWVHSYANLSLTGKECFMTLQCNHWLSRFAAVVMLLAVTACAGPTVLNTQWADSQFSAKPMRSILVVGITKDTSNRRVYEDAMVAQLTTRGVKAMPSYLFAPESGPVSLKVMEKALADFGATGVLLTRVVNVSQSVRVTPGIPPRNSGFGPSRNMGMRGFHGFYDGMWASSFHSPPTITVQENVAADTQLFETKDFSVVWSASTTTVTRASGSTTALLQQFAALIAETLAKDGLI